MGQGAGGAGGGGGTGGGAAGAAGAAQNIDFTFGQKGVYDDRTKKELALLLGLISASGNQGTKTTAQGSSPAPVQATPWNPQVLMSILNSFRGRG